MKFTTQRTRLAPGDTVVLFTDGVTEAMSATNGLFTLERLETELRRENRRPAAGVTRGIIEAVRRFAAGREQNDDLTVLAVRWLERTVAPVAPSPTTAVPAGHGKCPRPDTRCRKHLLGSCHAVNGCLWRRLKSPANPNIVREKEPGSGMGFNRFAPAGSK